MFEICCILIQVRNNVTDELLKVMDDFAYQLKDVLESSKNLSSLVILTKNVGLRTDRLETRQKVCFIIRMNIYRLSVARITGGYLPINMNSYPMKTSKFSP